MIKKISFTFAAVLLSIAYQQSAFAQIKLRSPIRTWAGSEACLCPYDQVVTAGIGLQFPDEVYLCGRASAWYRSGGREPACYMEDMNPQGQRDAMAIEQECRAIGVHRCYVDFSNRF